MTDSLVSTAWVASHLANPDVIILDATYFLPDAGRDAEAEYEQAHIPGAVFMDLGRLRDTDNQLPSMMPTSDQFRHHVQALGVGSASHVILYDNSPIRTSARAWFILRHFGLPNLSILDGGFGKWREEHMPLQSGRHFRDTRPLQLPKPRDDVRTIDHMRRNLFGRREQVVDARSAARFAGEEEETRPGVKPGHIPRSLNLPYSRLFNGDGTWKRGDALRAAFREAGVDLEQPMVTTCGSGITAAAVLFGAHLLGKEDVGLYDGSWTEWGADPETPKDLGRA